jgi:hypothetical protein
MGGAPTPGPGGLLGLIAGAKTAWGYFFGTVVLVALGFSWLARNWAIAQPVIEHPFVMFMGALAFMILGAVLVYLLLMHLVVAPLRAELKEARADIEELRSEAAKEARISHKEERELRDLITTQAAQIAELRTSVAFLREQVAQLTPIPPKRTRTPKS